jgi:hypothetical protein
MSLHLALGRMCFDSLFLNPDFGRRGLSGHRVRTQAERAQDGGCDGRRDVSVSLKHYRVSLVGVGQDRARTIIDWAHRAG